MKRLLSLIVVAASFGVVSTAGAPGAAAQSTASPFSSTTQFCTKSTPPPGVRNASSPGVTPNSITIADQSLDTAVLKRLTGRDSPDYHGLYAALWDEINRCGGINGRKIIFKKALFNAAAVDQAGHQQSQCLRITEDFKALLVSGISANSTARCTSVNHKTIQLAPQSANATSRDFADSKGRILSLYPAAESLVGAYIKDAVAESTFKGHTVAVVASATLASVAGDVQEQYIKGLEKVGVAAKLELLPCVGTVCTIGLGNAMRRMKANGVDVIVLTTSMSSTAMGAFLREMRSQGVNAILTGPYNGSVVQDSTLPTTAAGAGTDGLAFASRVGWTVVADQLVGGWRAGKIKETPFARMCLNTIAKATGLPSYPFIETNLTNGAWGAATNICAEVRAVAQAIHSVGNTLTTERLVKALSTVDLPRRDTGPVAKDRAFYSGSYPAPQAFTTLRYNYPCPLPRGTITTTGCFTPRDSPPRFRVVT